MSQENSNHLMPDTSPLYRLIRKTRHLLRSSWVATGLGLTCGLLFGASAAMVLLDLGITLWPEVDPALRLTALLLIVVPAAWAFFAGVIRPLFRRLAPVTVARKIESHLPGIHNRIVSCIDLDATDAVRRERSPAFYRRLIQEAVTRIRNFRPSTVVDFLSLRRAGAFAAGSIAAFVLVAYLFSNQLPMIMARIFRPFDDLPPVAFVRYTVSPGNDRVLRGDDVTFTVQVERGNPKDLTIELRSDKAPKPLRHELKKADGNLWKFTLNTASAGDGFDDSFRYRVFGGGTWSKQYQITVVERPVIVSLDTVLHYPEYMGLDPQPGGSAHAGASISSDAADVNGPEDSKVEVVVEVEGNVARGEIQWLESRQCMVEVPNRTERPWFEDQPPAGAHAEFWQPQNQDGPAHTDPAAPGEHRHWFQNSATSFRVEPGESLFTYVYLVPGKTPEALMVQWHDGQGWQHGACWGAEAKIKEGRPNTPSRRYLGDLPAAGKWVRLEVPSDFVNLGGKELRGMAFIQFGGQCVWRRAGSLPASHKIGTELVVMQPTYPMHPLEDGKWSGLFPLKGNGLYRVELHNELGAANKTMKEHKFVSYPDKPPVITMKHPGEDRTFSKPEKMPLIMEAYDDFGLKDVTLHVRRGDSGGFDPRVVKTFDKPQPRQTVTTVTSLDLAGMGLKLGDSIRYYAEARDRKGQTAKTPEFTVRIKEDAAASDQQLAQFEKNQEDPFRQKLIKLIAEQTKVHEVVEKLSAKYAPLDEKIKAAREKARKDAVANPAKPNPAQPKDPNQPNALKLDPETEKALADLRKELAQLFPPETQNVQLGQQINTDLEKMIDQAAKMHLLPQLADEKKALKDAFQQRALDPLQDLAARFQQGGNQQQPPPDLKEIKELSERIQRELDALKDDEQKLADARNKLKTNPDEGLSEHQRKLMEHQAGLTARDLEDLKNFLESLRKNEEQMKGEQEKLYDRTGKAADAALPEMENQQDQQEMDQNDALQDTRDLLANKDKMKAMKKKRKPSFPDEPYDPDAEEMVRPKEQDSDEPLPEKKKDKSADANDKEGKANKKDDDDDKEEDLFLPALGGPKQKEDPRFADKKRPNERHAKKGDKNDPAERRENLRSRQENRMDALDQAKDSLGSDEQTLGQLLNQLQNAMGKSHSGKPQQGNDQDGDGQKLSKMMRSAAMQQAMAMAARMRQMRSAAGRHQGRPMPNPFPMPNPNGVGDLQGSPKGGIALPSELNKLDPETRAAIMKLPPQLQEELLLGRSDDGPEGYRKFIQDYFKRLTDVKKTP